MISILITCLNNMYPGKVFFDYSQEIAGKFLSYLAAIYFALFFLAIGIYEKLVMLSLFKSNFLPNTPEFVILFFAISLACYVSYKGVTNIARMFELYGVIFIVVTVGICVLMLTQGTVENILPFYNPNETSNSWKAIKGFITSYSGIEVLLIVPFTMVNKNAPKIAFTALLFIGLLYVLVVESTIMSLGINNTIIYNDSFIEAIKVTEMPVLERVDLFYLTFGLISLFAGLILAFTAAVEFSCRVFPKAKRLVIVASLGVLSYASCLIAMGIKNIDDIIDKHITYPILVSSLFIPVLYFVIAKIKKHTAQQPNA